MNKYLKEYEWSNIASMLKNNKADPKEEQADCDGILVVITGATSGIGYETAKMYAAHGANLLCINRNEIKSKKLKTELEKEFHISCRFYIADFSKLSDIRDAATMLAELPEDIDILIHNAGVFNTKKQFTDDGIEEVFQVNYLGSFIINYLIKEKLKEQKSARIIHVNSEGHRFAIKGLKLDDLNWKHQRYSGLKGYGSAKTAQLLSLFPFSDYFSGSQVTINAMHPGDVKTNMGENNGRMYRFVKHFLINPSAKDPILSAKALYYLGISGKVSLITGKFFNYTTLEMPAPHALDVELAGKLWDLSIEMGGLL